MLPSNYSAASVSDLIADITAANTTGGSNTITLTAPTTSPYVLTAVNNTTNGATGLPVIAANDNLTIVGNGDTIERSTVSGTAAFRLVDVAAGASLTLQNLTLQGGRAVGSPSAYGSLGADPLSAMLAGAAEGGAIYNQGTLVLSSVTVQGNIAELTGRAQTEGIPAAGGGIFSARPVELEDGATTFSSGSSVTLEDGTIIHNNEAIGSIYGIHGTYGGNAYGGGLFAIGATVTVTNATVDNNTARAGYGYSSAGYTGGSGYVYGGGLYAAGGTVALTNAILDGNVAGTSFYNNGGGAFGGGLSWPTMWMCPRGMGMSTLPAAPA